MNFTLETFFENKPESTKKIEKTKFENLHEFLNPTKGKYIVLPNGFGGKNCPIFKTMIKDGFNFFNKDGITLSKIKMKVYEKYLTFASMIYKSYSIASRKQESFDVPYIFFNMSNDSKFNLETILGIKRSNATKMVNFFIKYGFIEQISEYKSYINWNDENDDKKTYSRRFIVNTQFYREAVKYYFKFDESIENRNNFLNNTSSLKVNEKNEIKFEKLLLNDEVIKSFTFPTYEEVLSRAKEMVENKKTDKHNRQYVFNIPSEFFSEENGKIKTKKRSDGSVFKYTVRGKLKENCPFVDINSHINSYVIMMNNEKVVRERKVYKDDKNNKYYDRFYCTLSLFPKWIREMIKIDSEDIVEIDATALHSRIVGKLFSNSFFSYPQEELQFLSEDSHYRVAQFLNVERSEAKQIALSYWNSKIENGKTISSKKNKELFEKMDNFLYTNHKDFFDFLVYIKNDMKSIKGTNTHSNMSVLLMDYENRIMNDIINSVGTHVIYVYDCIYVKKSEFDRVNKIFQDTIKKWVK